MNYYQALLRDTLNDMRLRAITTQLRENHELKDLYDYLAKHDVASLYEELDNGTLSKSIINQYGLFCDIVQEIVQ